MYLLNLVRPGRITTLMLVLEGSDIAPNPTGGQTSNCR